MNHNEVIETQQNVTERTGQNVYERTEGLDVGDPPGGAAAVAGLRVSYFEIRMINIQYTRILKCI